MNHLTRSKFKHEIRVGLTRKGFSGFSALAKRMGVTDMALHTFFAGRSNNVRLAVAMCQAVGVDVSLAYETCGLPVPGPDATKIEASYPAPAGVQ